MPFPDDFLCFLFSFWMGEIRDFPQKGYSQNFGFYDLLLLLTQRTGAPEQGGRGLPPAPVDGQPKITVNNDVPNT